MYHPWAEKLYKSGARMSFAPYDTSFVYIVYGKGKNVAGKYQGCLPECSFHIKIEETTDIFLKKENRRQGGERRRPPEWRGNHERTDQKRRILPGIG
jgi:hypothetical protein